VRLGVVQATWVTEGLTAIGILALLPLPLFAGLAVLPLIGLALNGTSSVLYGTVPSWSRPSGASAPSASSTPAGSVAGALSPVLYGMVSDLLSVPVMMMLVAAVVLITLPLAWGLRPALREIAAHA